MLYKQSAIDTKISLKHGRFKYIFFRISFYASEVAENFEKIPGVGTMSGQCAVKFS